MQIGVHKSLVAIFTVPNLRSQKFIKCIGLKEQLTRWRLQTSQTWDYELRYFIAIIYIMQILWMLFACITDAQNASFLTHLWLLVVVISWWVNSSSTIACNPYHVLIKLLVPFWCTTANCVIQICSIHEIR